MTEEPEVRVEVECPSCAARVWLRPGARRANCRACRAFIVIDDDFLDQVIADELARGTDGDVSGEAAFGRYHLRITGSGAPTATPRTEQFRLNRGWLVSEVLTLPLGLAVAVVAILVELDDGMISDRAALGAILAVWIGVGLLLLVRIPALIYTLVREPNLVLGPDALRVPATGLFQLRAWTIPWTELASAALTRRGGGSTKLTLTLRSGRVRTVPAHVLPDRYRVLRAIEQRR